MQKIHFTSAMLIIASLVGGCGSMATSTSMLEQVRADYAAAQNDARIASYASAELQSAGLALVAANQAAGKNESAEDVNKLAYLAQQKLALTQEVAKQKEAEASLANSGKQRDKMRLEQRTMEVNQAVNMANQAKRETAQAQSDAAQAQNDSMNAQRQTQDANARAALLAQQLSQLASKKTERGIVITLGDVLFATDMANLSAAGVESVQTLANILQQNPQRVVQIEGFTDSTGSAAHNQELSQRRASVVRKALQEIGIGPDRMTIFAYGEAFPVAANDTAAHRQLNRRVEIVLSDDSGKIAAR